MVDGSIEGLAAAVATGEVVGEASIGPLIETVGEAVSEGALGVREAETERWELIETEGEAGAGVGVTEEVVTTPLQGIRTFS